MKLCFYIGIYIRISTMKPKLRQPTGQRQSRVRRQQKEILIGLILFWIQIDLGFIVSVDLIYISYYPSFITNLFWLHDAICIQILYILNQNKIKMNSGLGEYFVKIEIKLETIWHFYVHLFIRIVQLKLFWRPQKREGIPRTEF